MRQSKSTEREQDQEQELFPVVIVSRNNLDLLQGAVRSALDQDVPTSVLVYDNGSDDGTIGWLHSVVRRPDRRISMAASRPQHSVSSAWNWSLRWLFGFYERVLVINQDVVLRPDTVRWLRAEQAMFVTAVGSADPKSIEPSISLDDIYPERIGSTGGPYAAPDVDDFRDAIQWSATLGYPPPRPDATRPHPDFSCFMISRECYEWVGPFDECFTPAWFEDNSYHIRMHRAGIRAYCIDLPFWHVGGGAQTLKRMPEGPERDELMRAFNRNRELFISMYGCDPADTEKYERLFA